MTAISRYRIADTLRFLNISSYSHNGWPYIE